MADKNASAKRRIVFVLPALTAGGAERVLITLMNGLDSQRFEKHFITVNEDGPLRSLIDSEISFHSLGHGTRVSRSLFRLYSKLRDLNPDIVVSTMAHMNYGVLLLKPFFPHTRFVVREAVTPSYFMQRGALQKSLIQLAYRVLYPYADLVISPAQQIIDEFSAMGMKVKNFAFLPNPVQTEKIRASGAPVRLPGIRYVCAGRLDPQKGFDRLIENLQQLKSGTDWHVTILGEGWQRSELEKLIKDKGFSGKVELAGHAANPWPHIAGADAFLMPSRYEGLPNAALESLACGTPVIATHESGGIAEIAALAAPGSVTVVNSMDEFIAAMSKVEAYANGNLRPSLLPESYEYAKVVESFTGLLDKVSADQGHLERRSV